ncbi:MAG TPA: trypsin-like peptidase domain-containing protein [Tepidisphaeraceae bacterium]|nr:trypsin-like peptidase domain-containing protein [Tepidisphaeraceae bacterium]
MSGWVRRRAAGMIFALCGALALWGCAAPEPYPSATPWRVVAVTSRISPAVVRLDVAQAVYRDGKRSLERGIGSGVIIDQDGRILTNYHVAGRATEIYATLASEERVPARLIGDDHWTDLAIVQMDMAVVRKKHITFASAELGNSSALVVGQDVMAFGTPYGLSRTVTSGHVSATDRTLYPQQLDIDGYETGEFANWIQMDAPINPGNSGGPLVDLDGKVVGINTRGGAQNLNFAIPIDTAKQVIAAIEASSTPTTLGHVPRSDLGLELKPLQDLESFYHLDIDQGVLVDSVMRGGPADTAGIRPQDILLDVNGEPTNVRFPEELAPVSKRIADLPIGSKAVLTVKRGDKVLTLTAATEALQGYFGDERSFPAWGISARPVTRPYADRNELDSDKGVWVTGKTPDLPADKADLNVGDVIFSVGGAPVADMADFTRLYDASIKRQDSSIPLEVRQDRSIKTIVLEMDSSPDATAPAE